MQGRLLGRSLLAVLSGYFALAIVVVILTPVAARLFIPRELLLETPPRYTTAYIVANYVYSFAGAVLGGWVTGRLAPAKPLAHGATLGGVMVLIAISDAIRAANLAAGSVPAWYGWTIALTGAVGASVGGWWRDRQLKLGAGGVAR